MRRTGLTTIAVAVLALVVAAPGAPIARADNYFLRNFTWFGFVEGKELRQACAPGSADRLRFIYQAVFDQQIRVYEIERPGPGMQAALNARVLTKIDYSNFTFSEFFLGTRDRVAQAVLDPAGYEALLAAVYADGFADPVPSGLKLPSDGFYWVISACLNGRYRINGWAYPSERFKALRFPALLFGRDGTGVAITPPRETDPGERMRARGGSFHNNLDARPAFDIRLDENGVVGRMPGL